ncbi:MAG: T9SS type A sorting domain-containing protein [Flavobacteriaceae bacterium]|nr:T9SS type A sorting domain-containing protein [Flavobacteriaceae bacterium]
MSIIFGCTNFGKRNNKYVETSGLLSGVYIVRVSDGREIRKSRIIIK